MMRTDFPANFHAARPRFAQKPNASRRAHVLAMDVVIAAAREKNVSHHDYFLAAAGPTGQPQERAPVPFVDHSIAHQVVILTMIEDRYTDHARVFHRAPHQLVVLNAPAIVGDRDYAGLFQRTDRSQLFAEKSLRDCA